jgi:general secretion pathway protein G
VAELSGATTVIVGSNIEEKRPGRAVHGFTLLELMVVIAIIVILAGLSAGRFETAMIRTHEAALRQDLSVMRQAIQNYTLDKEAAPGSLEDLHSAGYIGEVPTDPITGQKDWVTDECNDVLSPEQIPGGVCDVHSASGNASPFDGKPYDQY